MAPGLRWSCKAPLCLVAWQLFTSLQLGNSMPFFGLSVQGGFRTEVDISTAARAVRGQLDEIQHKIVSFSALLPLTTVSHNVTAGALLQLYNNVLLARVVSFTDRIGWAAGNSTDAPADVFQSLGRAYVQTVGALEESALAAVNIVASYSAPIGAQLNDTRAAMVAIVGDINATLVTFERTITSGVLATPLTAQAIFAKLSKSQIGLLVGALDALRVEVTVFTGKLLELTVTLTEADALMSSYLAMLSQSFTNLDNGQLTGLFRVLTRASTEFSRQFSASETTVTTAVATFNARLATFTDDVIGAGAANIRAITEPFGQTLTGVYSILQPNVDERLQLLTDTASDAVLSVAQNLLFITYRALEGVMRRIPTAPSQGRACASEHISPFVQSLASNLASALSGCIASTGGQAEAVLRNLQQQSIEGLVRDRLAYVRLWNDALNGVSSTSDATTRRIAFAKLTARTTNQSIDTQQPALASSFSLFAQLVSNLDAVLNRAELCLALRSAELSAQLVPAEVNFNTCLRS